MIQILTYSGSERELNGAEIKVNRIHDAESLDSFEINIICLQDKNIWHSKESKINTINSIDDLNSLSGMIKNSRQSNIVIFLPQNNEYAYNTWRRDSRDWFWCELKNMLPVLKGILSHVFSPINDLDIVYENTVTILGNSRVPAAFHFGTNIESDFILTKSDKSKKITSIKMDNIILSTLKITNIGEIMEFLKIIGLVKETLDIPSWMDGVKMFDDNVQLKIIEKNNAAIKDANDNISKAMEIISKNNRYKSILYTNGDELVNVVFEILENMLGCDLSEFHDKKKEDFNFTLGETTFIGEIKGVSPNVKKANISQVDVHVQEYLDDHYMDEKNIVSLLVINHQRNKPLQERETIPEDQIKLAKRNGSLIIETFTLLKLFEQYLSGEKNREECIDILANNTGVLSL